MENNPHTVILNQTTIGMTPIPAGTVATVLGPGPKGAPYLDQDSEANALTVICDILPRPFVVFAGEYHN